MTITHPTPVDLLRFATSGSVDDGKSTLIGRLLYDSKSLMEDQLEALQRSADLTGHGQINLANLTDGLRAEREQGITIDVAYRYFATPRRKFIIADTPGHIQYTRNMVTGASSANLAIVLVDARQGVIEQSRRHTAIASLLRIPHLVVAINKMDLVDWSRARFDEIREEFEQFLPRLDMKDVKFIPVSALHGDNVVDPSPHTPWYPGPTLLGHLETVHLGSDWNLSDFRLPVQWVIRPNNPTDPALHDFRGLSGQIAGGIVREGQLVQVLPSGFLSKVKQIWTLDGPLKEAFCPQSVTLVLEDDIDVSRGDLIVHPVNLPGASNDLHARVCWLHARPLAPHPDGSRDGDCHRKPHRRDHARPTNRRGLAGDERRGCNSPAHGPAAPLRRVRRQPADRLFHPHRTGQQRHGWRGDVISTHPASAA